MRRLVQNDHPIKRILTVLNLTYRELGINTGINYESLCRYANRKKKPSAKNSYKIIDFAKKNGINICLEDLMPR